MDFTEILKGKSLRTDQSTFDPIQGFCRLNINIDRSFPEKQSDSYYCKVKSIREDKQNLLRPFNPIYFDN
jgi:hypothetical protein